jgi:hypothetical protein
MNEYNKLVVDLLNQFVLLLFDQKMFSLVLFRSSTLDFDSLKNRQNENFKMKKRNKHLKICFFYTYSFVWDLEKVTKEDKRQDQIVWFVSILQTKRQAKPRQRNKAAVFSVSSVFRCRCRSIEDFFSFPNNFSPVFFSIPKRSWVNAKEKRTRNNEDSFCRAVNSRRR